MTTRLFRLHVNGTTRDVEASDSAACSTCCADRSPCPAPRRIAWRPSAGSARCFWMAGR